MCCHLCKYITDTEKIESLTLLYSIDCPMKPLSVLLVKKMKIHDLEF